MNVSRFLQKSREIPYKNTSPKYKSWLAEIIFFYFWVWVKYKYTQRCYTHKIFQKCKKEPFSCKIDLRNVLGGSKYSYKTPFRNSSVHKMFQNLFFPKNPKNQIHKFQNRFSQNIVFYNQFQNTPTKPFLHCFGLLFF